MNPQLLNRAPHRQGAQRLRGGDAQAFRQQLARGSVHGCALERRAANIDAECFHEVVRNGIWGKSEAVTLSEVSPRDGTYSAPQPPAPWA